MIDFRFRREGHCLRRHLPLMEAMVATRLRPRLRGPARLLCPLDQPQQSRLGNLVWRRNLSRRLHRVLHPCNRTARRQRRRLPERSLRPLPHEGLLNWEVHSRHLPL